MSMLKLSRARKSLIALSLTAIGFGINAIGLSLFVGVDLFFGGVAALVALVILGPLWAVPVAVGSAMYSVSALHHPYAIFIFTIEVLAVSSLLRRCRGSLILASGAYWLILGAPLVWFFYSFIMHLDHAATTLIILRTAVNGIANASIASFILFAWPRRLIPVTALDAGPTLFRLIFSVIVGSIFLPGLIVVWLNGRETFKSLEDHLYQRLHAIATGLSQQVMLWKVHHLRAVEELASLARDFQMKPGKGLQTATTRLTRMNPEFRVMFVADASATTIAVEPEVNALGESTIGLNYSDREYYRAVKKTLAPHVSDVFRARGTIFDPVVTLTVPVIFDQQFRGFAIAALNLHRISELLQITTAGTHVNATIISGHEKIIASTIADGRPLDDSNALFTGELREINDGFYQRMPGGGLPPYLQWQQSHFGMTMPINDLPGWKIRIEIPASQHLSYLYARQSASLAVLLLLTAVGYVVAALFATKAARPLAVLAEETHDLPDKILRDQSIHWPSSSVAEVTFLIQNFQSMTDALKTRFDDLKKSNQLKDQFLATLSHELRTPLNVISGYVELLQDDGWTEDSPGFIEVISRNVKQLGRLIEELLDLSRIASGKMNFAKVPVDLGHSIELSLESVQLSAEEKGLAVSFIKPNESLWSIGDPSKLTQVWWNLLSNSLKFTPSGGEIRLSLSRVDGEAVIKFEDTGIGMSPEFVSQAFGRFVQEDGSTRRAHGGLGIGLAIVREIIEKHGGTITASSEGRNKGTTMTIRLPLFVATTDSALAQVPSLS